MTERLPSPRRPNARQRDSTYQTGQRCSDKRDHLSIYQQPSPDEVHAQLDRVTDQLQNRFPQVASLLDEAGPDVLAFSSFPLAHWKKIWSNNPQERLNKEIRRRTDVVGSSLTGRPCAASLAPSWLSSTTNGPLAVDTSHLSC